MTPRWFHRWAPLLGYALVVAAMFGGFVRVQTVVNDNRETIRGLCATTAAIRNLDQFFLGIAKPRPDETEEQRKVRLAFVRLVKADIERMDAAGGICARL